MVSRAHRVLTLIALLALAAPLAGSDVGAQTTGLPGLRGSLYESPEFGWVLIVPEPAWEIASVELEGGVETVHLVSTSGDGADAVMIASRDDGRGAEGCVQDLIDNLAESYGGSPLLGWHGPEVEREEFMPGVPLANARVDVSDDSGLDILAQMECRRSADGVIIAMTLLRTARGVESTEQLPSLEPLVPGEGHTGRARAGRDADPPEQGVVRFLARTWPAMEAYPSPFSCADQMTFPRPSEAPPAGRGWFSCDGQIANIDIVPATIDLEAIVLGCANVPAADPLPSGCPSAPVAPTHYEVLQGPADAAGPSITLAPGESVEVVLWYALPAGDPPLDVVYVEPDRIIVAGPTDYTQGSGSRPQVETGR